MNRLMRLTFIVMASLLLHSTALRAQNYQLTYFQCDPISCSMDVGPTTTGSVEVDWYATCDTPSNPNYQFSGYVKGYAVNCSQPYLLVADAESTSTTEFYMPCNKPYEMDGVIGMYDLYLGTTEVYYATAYYWCDGTSDPPVVSGPSPC